MAVLHSFWWEEGERAFARCSRPIRPAPWPLGTSAECVGQSLRRGPGGADPGSWRRGGGAGGGDRCRPRVSRASSMRSRRCTAMPRRPRMRIGCGPTRTPSPGCTGIFPRRRGHDLPRARARRHRPSHRYHLRPAEARDRAAGSTLRSLSRPSRARALHHPLDRLSDPRVTRAEGGPALRHHRSRRPACAAHAIAHLRAAGAVGRDGLREPAGVPGGYGSHARHAKRRARAEELHVLDYAVTAISSGAGTRRRGRPSRGANPRRGALQERARGGVQPDGDGRPVPARAR